MKERVRDPWEHPIPRPYVQTAKKRATLNSTLGSLGSLASGYLTSEAQVKSTGRWDLFRGKIGWVGVLGDVDQKKTEHG